MSDYVKHRTDVVLSSIMGLEPPMDDYLKSLDGNIITKEDLAAMAMTANAPIYSMRDLGSALPPSQMVIPDDYQSYLAGHSKISTSPLKDWPMVDENNDFGEHHPFGMNSNCCPLLQNAAHGEPHYVDHLFDFITHAAENHKENERMNKLSGEDAMLFGNPDVSMLDLYNKDMNRDYGADENWEQQKREYLANEFGLLPFLFGLEWHSPGEAERFYDILSNLSQTSDPESPEARSLFNRMQEKTGIKWDRYLRNWRDRFTPLSAWWQRPSDRSGPTASPPADLANAMLTSPFSSNQEPGHNYHWWEPYQFHGGVGRSIDSLKSVMTQSYPGVFGDNWLSDFLLEGVPVDGPHMLSGSHFPASSNSAPELSSALSSLSTGDQSFERRRANWTHASMHNHLHPSEINDAEGRMTIPTEALLMSRFGDDLMKVTELGNPKAGRLREQHPNSNSTYYDVHNRHATNSDQALQQVMTDLATQVMQQFGSDIFAPVNGDVNTNTIARGNIGQLASAANHLLMRGEGVHDGEYMIPDVSSGQLSQKIGAFGPVSPMSESVVAPLFNSGNTDSWGHEMPATLTYKWDRNSNGLIWDNKESPFTILQRTPHKGLVSAVDPSFADKQIHTKNKEINALSTNSLGYSNLTSLLHKSDDYELTGIFDSMIEPAHVVRDLDDMDTLKGFSGDWVVQKKPKGKRVLVKKSGKSIDPISLPSKVKKSLKDTIQGDATFDGYVSGDVLTVVDLLVHKDTDMSQEPLSDRVDALRTLYSTTDHVEFPAPNSCVNTDKEGLIKTIANLDRTDLLIRDAQSTFIKGKEVHPKWILYPQDKISKEMPLPPLPEMSIRNSDLVLEYPGIYTPVIVKIENDDNGPYVAEYNGLPHLVKQAQTQFRLWSPVAAHYVGLPDQAIPSYRKRPLFRKSIDKAPEVNVQGEHDDEDSVSNIMRHARKAITSEERALNDKELIAHVDGLTQSMLDKYAGEYGLEHTEDGKWTVNEAIDDDIAEKFSFPRMNQASSDGGAWSGMQADITAPTGPTEITDEENTTFGNPRRNQQEPDPNGGFRPLSMIIDTENGQATLDVKDRKAVIRFPKKDKDHEERENEVLPALRHDNAL